MESENGESTIIDPTKVDQAPLDPDFEKVIGKPVIKVVWNPVTQQWAANWDEKVFRSYEFLIFGLKSIADTLEKEVDYHKGLANQRRAMQQLAQEHNNQVLANQIMQPQQRRRN